MVWAEIVVMVTCVLCTPFLCPRPLCVLMFNIKHIHLNNVDTCILHIRKLMHAKFGCHRKILVTRPPLSKLWRCRKLQKEKKRVRLLRYMYRWHSFWFELIFSLLFLWLTEATNNCDGEKIARPTSCNNCDGRRSEN